MTSVPLSTADLSWRERVTELQADRDYWRPRAESWEARYIEAAKQVAALAEKVVATPDPDANQSRLPDALQVAIDRASIGQQPEVVRVMRREVLATYATTQGPEDVKILAALKRITAGDGARVAAFLGEAE